MRIFQFIFLIPALLCTTVAFAAPACWEIKNACNDKNSCVLSAKTIDEHSVTTKYYFRCGGQDGCKPQTITRSNADMPTMYTYNECTSNGWKQIPDIKSYIQANINKIRNCGDNEASTKNVGYIVEAREISDEYDFIMEQHKTYALNSDICKKPKSDKVEKPQKTQTNTEKSAPVVKPDVTDTPTGTKNDAPQHVEQPVEKDAPKPAQVQNNITISGKVVDDMNLPIPQVNIVVVGNETYGVAANDDGQYTINGLSADSKLKFSSIGFEAVEKTVAELQAQPNVQLKEASTNIQEVTVTVCQKEDEEIDPKTGECVKQKSDIVDETKPAGESKEEKQNESPKSETSAPAPDPNELQEKLKSAKDALAVAKEKENSWANRALGATTTAATSLGAMQLAEGIAERKADEEAEKQMRNYISTMKCEYGGGKHVDFGVEETLPGGNELFEYYTEYKTLADNLKTTKAALGLSAGIESEVLYDRAQSGLYQYASTGKTGGGETSLFRALTDSESEDATAWSEQKETASKKLKVGGGVAAGGVAVGVIGNVAINTDMIQNIKDAFKK